MGSTLSVLICVQNICHALVIAVRILISIVTQFARHTRYSFRFGRTRSTTKKKKSNFEYTSTWNVGGSCSAHPHLEYSTSDSLASCESQIYSRIGKSSLYALMLASTSSLTHVRQNECGRSNQVTTDRLRTVFIETHNTMAMNVRKKSCHKSCPHNLQPREQRHDVILFP